MKRIKVIARLLLTLWVIADAIRGVNDENRTSRKHFLPALVPYLRSAEKHLESGCLFCHYHIIFLVIFPSRHTKAKQNKHRCD